MERLENALKQMRTELAEKEAMIVSLEREMEKMRKATQVLVCVCVCVYVLLLLRFTWSFAITLIIVLVSVYFCYIAAVVVVAICQVATTDGEEDKSALKLAQSTTRQLRVSR